MERFVWQHVAFELPADWEMLQFSREPAQGRCAFADRYQYRFEFNWRQVPGVPDFKRMISDYRARMELDHHLTDATDAKYGAWLGFHGRQGETFTSRFGHYFSRLKSVVEVVFLYPDARNRALEKSILASIRDEPPGEYVHWRAFGLDLKVPAVLAPDHFTVQPAAARMTFRKKKKPALLKAQRLGMVDVWLNMPVEKWLTQQMPPQVRKSRQSTREIQGHSMCIVQAPWASRGRLIPEGVYEAAAWICPSDQRLYHVERVQTKRSRERTAAVFLPEKLCACCGTLEETRS
jgi:hypothetical protein